jgi:DNA-directed RNA polymerase subunit L
VLVSGFGPLTISEDDINNLIGMATILAATVQYMEEDEQLANKLVEYCGKMFGDVGDFFYNADHDSFGDGNFTIDTKTVGGIQ